MPGKTLEELAAEMPDGALAVGELEGVIDKLKAILRETASNPADTRSRLLSCIAEIEYRIGAKLDESGKIRQWSAAWREAEAAESFREPPPRDTETPRLGRSP